MEDRKLIVIDKDGKEIEMYILFTYENPEDHKKYVFYTNPQDKNKETYVSSYDDEGNLFPVEKDEEWELLDDVFNDFQSHMDEDTECHCHEEGHECHCHDEGHECECGDEECECHCHDEGHECECGDEECECHHEHEDGECCCQKKEVKDDK